VQGEWWRSQCVAKRRDFYDVKEPVLTTDAGLPVEFAFIFDHAADVRGWTCWR
jgi:hypothetical protein